ncbi:MAG TPA: clostripain-related cysteine peptidase, partial [Elusimicrobiales bacterium]|nr:clostripain-related cysteine peptidase [Elusimicrobiales bacterium]
GTRRYLVQKDDNFSAVTSPVVQDLGKVDMGDYKNVIDFANWAKTNYPAKKYMLILWNHGAGWVKSRAAETKGISYDDETGHHLNTPQMGLVLKEIGGVDVYGSDACLMQMPEVDYEIKDYTQYIVGSEETEPGDGYTYNTFLGPIIANPAMTAEELGKQAVNAYADHYAGQSATQSLLKPSAFDGFVPLVNDFVAAAISANEKTLVKSARDKAQKYAYADNKDMYDFLKLYEESSASQDVKAKSARVREYLSGTLVVHNRTSGKYAGKSMGLAVYLPSSALNGAYNELAWSKVTQWDEFISWYLTKDEAGS